MGGPRKIQTISVSGALQKIMGITASSPQKIMGITASSQDPNINPKRAILGDQDSPKRAPESYVRLSWGCLGAINSLR